MAHELKDPEVIRQQMHQTRAALADKLESLEQHVIGTVHETTAAVANTAEKVSEVVEGTADTVKDTVETVKQTFDLPLQMERHPWVMMGGSVAVGFVLGRLLPAVPAPNGNGQGPTPAETPAMPTGGYHPFSTTSQGNGHATTPAKPSYLGELLAPELEKVKALAFGALVGVVRDMISKSIPSNLEDPVRDVMDRITSKLGGEPVRGPVLAEGPRRY